MTDQSALIIPFGKHRGATVAELLAKDPAYSQWLMSQGWLAERFAEVHAALATRGAISDDSPAHNALQVRFLDPKFREAFLSVAYSSHIMRIIDTEAGIHEALCDTYKTQSCSDPGSWWFMHYEKEIELLCDRLRRVYKMQEERLPLNIDSQVRFEQRGVDVVITWHVGFLATDMRSGHDRREYGTFGKSDYCWVEGDYIELKPQLSDDFPSVMREMQRCAGTGCRNIYRNHGQRGSIASDVRGQRIPAGFCA